MSIFIQIFIFIFFSQKQFLNVFYHKMLTMTYLYSAQKMKFSIKDFFIKCDQISWKQRIWPHLLKKSLMENFIFCAVVFFL